MPRQFLTPLLLPGAPTLALHAATKAYVDAVPAVPAGGAAGQVLAKASSANYDDVWVSPSGLVIFQGRDSAGATLTTANTWYAISLATEDTDSHNGHDTATLNYRYVAPVAGYYQVSASVLFSAGFTTTTPMRYIRLGKNGSQVANSKICGTYANALMTMVIPPVLVYCAVGDYVELHAMSERAGQTVLGNSTDGSMLTTVLVRAG